MVNIDPSISLLFIALILPLPPCKLFTTVLYFNIKCSKFSGPLVLLAGSEWRGILSEASLVLGFGKFGGIKQAC